jgi:Cu2+-exporting ATPase
MNQLAESVSGGEWQKRELFAEDLAGSITTDESGRRKLYMKVPDIRCAACTNTIETQLRRRADVIDCRTSLVDRRLEVVFEHVEPIDLLHFVESLGFHPLPDGSGQAVAAVHVERRQMLARLGVAGIGMMQVMMFALAGYVAGADGIEPAYEALMRWAAFCVATPVALFSAMPFHLGAWHDLKNARAGMDVPVSLAISAAYLLSAINTVGSGEHVYFDSVCMFTFLLLLGRFLELGSRQAFHSSQDLTGRLVPVTAVRAENGERIAVSELKVGEDIVVAAGEVIPVDGVIIKGGSSIADAVFTGESLPRFRDTGELVRAGSENLDAQLQIRMSALPQDFLINQLAQTIRESALYKPAFSEFADRVSRHFVATILLLAVTTAGYWYFAGEAAWFTVFLTVLVVSCPCALSLATPIAYAYATAALRRCGLAVGKGQLLENLTRVSRLIFDKTGTLTEGLPRIADVQLLADMSREQVLQVCASLETGSKHPIALAFQNAEVVSTRVTPVISAGQGVGGEINGVRYRLGKPDFAAPGTVRPKGPGIWILLASNRPLAWIQLVDELRPGAHQAIAELKRRYRISLLSGDSAVETCRVAGVLGIDDFEAELTPGEKIEKVRRYQQHGEVVLMVGDGINDAGAMALADCSIAIAPKDLAVQDSADATLLHPALMPLPQALDYAHKVKRIIRQNVSWAVLYNLSVIPLAVLGLIQPWVAALGMSISSLLVVLNANRLALAPGREE